MWILDTREFPGPTDSVKVGWRAGCGVWVLKTTAYEVSQKGAAVIHNAYSMEEVTLSSSWEVYSMPNIRIVNT